MENSVIKLYRVYRKDMNEQPWYATEYMSLECYILAKTWERAKGIAKDKYPSLFDNIPKKDVLVEEVVFDTERALISR